MLGPQNPSVEKSVHRRARPQFASDSNRSPELAGRLLHLDNLEPLLPLLTNLLSPPQTIPQKCLAVSPFAMSM